MLNHETCSARRHLNNALSAAEWLASRSCCYVAKICACPRGIFFRHGDACVVAYVLHPLTRAFALRPASHLPAVHWAAISTLACLAAGAHFVHCGPRSYVRLFFLDPDRQPARRVRCVRCPRAGKTTPVLVHGSTRCPSSGLMFSCTSRRRRFRLDSRSLLADTPTVLPSDRARACRPWMLTDPKSRLVVDPKTYASAISIVLLRECPPH